jgi:hypothetical protein
VGNLHKTIATSRMNDPDQWGKHLDYDHIRKYTIQACIVLQNLHPYNPTNWLAGYQYLPCILIREERLPTLICSIVTPDKLYFIWPDFVMDILHTDAKVQIK